MEYEVLARKFRPQLFSEVIGQKNILQTLMNALAKNRIAHAYLFSGPKGVGKTTFARLLAKALNCQQKEGIEPCNTCSSCKEIAKSISMDVIEIDGASNRGIDEIRKIKENVGYAASSGNYKIYIIDEVHMLTKEAFNALLKTLEEPPSHVKFFFATTHPSKLPTTIISRCQRFALERFSTSMITEKLETILKSLTIEYEKSALLLIANVADGSMRDAESLLDQVIAFESKVNRANVIESLGIVEKKELYFLDELKRVQNIGPVFELTQKLITSGKDLNLFLEDLMQHIRHYLIIAILKEKATEFLQESTQDMEIYFKNQDLYSKELCLYLLEYLIQSQERFHFTSNKQVLLEVILLEIIQSQKPKRFEDLLDNMQQQPKAKPQEKKKMSQNKMDTIIRFSQVELEGILKKTT
ncbi:MAG: DNA polymerase III subunit tau [Chlamydiae bacterium]|nr:DNA polymerase III subunit tau [Chlamydiota bacterium]